MVILFFGDVFGRPGREALKKILPNWYKKYKPDFTIANIENIAHGSGITYSTLKDIDDLGIFNAYTSGNHIWNRSETKELLQNDSLPILRPLNYTKAFPGKGYKIIQSGAKRLLIINLLGRVFMKDKESENLSNLLLAVDEVLEDYSIDEMEITKDMVDGIFIDIHAEATAEKRVLGAYLDGRVSAIVGTHTHVPTRDEQILPHGTAYITDVGMVGPYNSSVGLDFKNMIQEYLTETKQKKEIGDDPLVEIGAVLIKLNKSGLADKIQHLRELVQK